MKRPVRYQTRIHKAFFSKLFFSLCLSQSEKKYGKRFCDCFLPDCSPHAQQCLRGPHKAPRDRPWQGCQTNQPANPQAGNTSKQADRNEGYRERNPLRRSRQPEKKQAPRILSLNDTQSGSIKELTNSGHGNATPYRSTGLVHVASKTKCRETPASKQIRMKDTADVVHREDKGKQKKNKHQGFSPSMTLWYETNQF